MLLRNPYLGLRPDQRRKTSVVISLDDQRRIQLCHFRDGTTQLTLGLLNKKWITLLNHLHFDNYDPDRYERILAACVLTLPDGGAFNSLDTETPVSDDTPGDGTVGGETTGTERGTGITQETRERCCGGGEGGGTTGGK